MMSLSKTESKIDEKWGPNPLKSVRSGQACNPTHHSVGRDRKIQTLRPNLVMGVGNLPQKKKQNKKEFKQNKVTGGQNIFPDKWHSKLFRIRF